MREYETSLNSPALRRRWGALLLLLMAVVSWLAFSPSGNAPSLVPHADKLAHLLAFAALSAVATLASSPGRPALLRNALALLAYGLFIEAVQLFLPSRSAEWADVAADALGIALGQSLVLWLRARRTAAQPIRG